MTHKISHTRGQFKRPFRTFSHYTEVLFHCYQCRKVQLLFFHFVTETNNEHERILFRLETLEVYSDFFINFNELSDKFHTFPWINIFTRTTVVSFSFEMVSDGSFVSGWFFCKFQPIEWNVIAMVITSASFLPTSSWDSFTCAHIFHWIWKKLFLKKFDVSHRFGDARSGALLHFER